MKNIPTILIYIFSFFITMGIVNGQNYDYLIITPDVFLENATWDDELINLQTSRGFNPLIYVVTEQTSAQTIKNYIQNCYNNNPLKYVLLMGSGKNLIDPEAPVDTTIPYGYLQHGIVNTQVDYLNGTYIPFFSVYCNNPWNPNGGLNVATDDPYISGLTSHGSVYIGRVPVTSVTEANNYVSKLFTYYQSLETYSEAMNRVLLLNLDMTWVNGGVTGGFVQYINNEIKNDHIPGSTSIVELNVSEHNQGCDHLGYCWQREQTFQNTLNQGASVISILGTIGGPNNFGGWYWNNSSFSLTNKTTGMPFLMAPNCHQGEVNNPDYESTMRKLMVHDNGGIIGAIAPTEGTEQNVNGIILKLFYDLLFQNNTPTYGEIFKILKNELFTNSQWEFYNNGLTFFGDPSLASSIVKHRSGTISSSQTWSGNFVIDNSINIINARTLTLLPGTNLFFPDYISLTSTGTLTAIGTPENKITFSKTGLDDWGSIIFDGGSSSSSILDNVIIKNSFETRCLNNANVIIRNSLIDHCYNGIYIYNSTPQIIGNDIIDPSSNGIYGEANGKAPLIKQNTIKKETMPLYFGQGIYFQNYTNPFITENDIQGFNSGIYFSGGGTGYLTDNNYVTPTINNRFTNHVNGITVNWGSYLLAGFNFKPTIYRSHQNSIYNNSGYDAVAFNSARLIAKKNWWGSDGAQTLTQSGGYIDASSPLTYNPWGDNPNNDNQSEIEIEVVLRDSTSIGDILSGLNLEFDERISEVIVHYKNMIRNLSHPRFALIRLLAIKNRYSINNIQNYLISLQNGNTTYKPALLNLIAGMYLDDDRYDDAMQLYNLIINNYPNSFDAVNSLFEKFFAALHYVKDITLASQLLSQLQSLNITDEDFLMRLEVAENMLNGTSSDKLSKGSIDETNDNEISLPKEYSLLGNYPNPFNPTTTISYALPFQSSVELVIYDIMGAKVKSFSISSQSSGYQNIVWEGRNENGNFVASGIYLYRISIKSLENNETFVKTAKLMMLK